MKVSINQKPVRIVIIDYVNSIWTNPIVRSFQSSLDRTHENISYYHFVWTNKTNNSEFIKEIVAWKPDVVFMPDEILYRMFSAELAQKTGAHLSTFFCTSTRLDIIDYPNQSGVFNEYPADKVIEFARKSFPVNKVALIGGPFAEDVITKIRLKLDKSVVFDGFIVNKWLDYKEKLFEIEKKYDAVWLLLPFGVYDGEHVVDFQKLDVIAKRLKIPTFGYGGVDGLTRTISIGLVQEKVGQFCATLVFSAIFKGNNPGIQNYSSYDVLVNAEHVLKLGLKISDEMAQFFRE